MQQPYAFCHTSRQSLPVPMEATERAGEKLGLPRSLARPLTRKGKATETYLQAKELNTVRWRARQTCGQDTDGPSAQPEGDSGQSKSGRGRQLRLFNTGEVAGMETPQDDGRENGRSLRAGCFSRFFSGDRFSPIWLTEWLSGGRAAWQDSRNFTTEIAGSVPLGGSIPPVRWSRC